MKEHGSLEFTRAIALCRGLLLEHLKDISYETVGFSVQLLFIRTSNATQQIESKVHQNPIRHLQRSRNQAIILTLPVY